jgi:hypothetical protein
VRLPISVIPSENTPLRTIDPFASGAKGGKFESYRAYRSFHSPISFSALSPAHLPARFGLKLRSDCGYDGKPAKPGESIFTLAFRLTPIQASGI